MSGLLLTLIVAFLVRESYDAWQQIGASRLLSDHHWSPTGPPDRAEFGLTPMILASLSVTAGAVLLATPLGLGAAICLVFYAPQSLQRTFSSIVELLAGIPSVVYGLWGLVVLVPWINHWKPPGTSLLAGIIILAIMILPTIALFSRAAFQQIPDSLLRSSAALGFSSVGTLTRVLIPTAQSGIIASIVLGIARAIGETMAVLMVCGNVIETPTSLFAPVRTLTANIAIEMAYALDLHRSALFATGLVLIAIVTVLILITEGLRTRSRHA